MAQVQSAASLTPMGNPALMADPSYMQQMLQTQRQQALAQALTEQGMAPIDYDPKGRISPWQGVNKMAQALMGAYTANNAIKGQAALQAQSIQSNLQQLGAGQQPQGPQQGQPQALAAALSPQIAAQQAMAQGAPQGSVGPTVANGARMDQLMAQQPQQAVAPQGGPAQSQGLPGSVRPTGINPYGLDPMLLLRAQNGDPVAKAQMENLLKNFEQTDTIKNNNAFGITPAEAKAMAIAKATKESQIEYSPGQFTSNAFTGQGSFYPAVPANSQPTGPIGSNGQVPGVAPVPGAAGVIQSNAAADQFGHTAATIGEAPGPNGVVTKGYNKDLFGNPVIPPAVQAGRNVDQLAILRQERANPGNSAADNASLDREIARAGGTRVIAGPDPTIQSGRTDQQGDMGKRWSTLSSQAGNAQKVNSYLDNIGSLADKAATGQFADRLQLTNSLLAPFSQRATDATTASNLLDKYSNQIVAQLGSGGGMSTDAARDILHSAYPNRSMNAPAIHEAVNALKAQSVMAQAKARILQPAYTSNDPVSYTKAETAFDQAADPRIFQWRAIADPAARRAFGAKIMAQDPSLAAKAKALEAMGVQ